MRRIHSRIDLLTTCTPPTPALGGDGEYKHPIRAVQASPFPSQSEKSTNLLFSSTQLQEVVEYLYKQQQQRFFSYSVLAVCTILLHAGIFVQHRADPSNLIMYGGQKGIKSTPTNSIAQRNGMSSIRMLAHTKRWSNSRLRSIGCKKEEDVDAATYVFGRPGELKRDLKIAYRLGTTPRRVTLGVGTASALALIGNFVGITDSLLSTNPQISRSLKLDQLYAVGGLRGYYTSEYVVLYPKNWLFDQSVAQAQAYRKEAESRFARPRFEDGVDDLLLARKSDRNLIPDAAFGPPKGGKGLYLTLISPFLSSSVPSIQVLLGEPEQALERLLSTTIAPEGSGKKAKIIAANKRPGGEEAYDFEYILTLPNQMQIHTCRTIHDDLRGTREIVRRNKKSKG
eukprot:jgi/Bigna1/69782/fgenesh1_pg.10_\